MKDAASIGITIIQTLVDKGHIAYFAGGWVRDYLLGIPNTEIDIATSASPEQVVALFPKSILVGIQFGVVVVVVEGVHFEVATFRQDKSYQDGRHPEGVLYSTPEEDALRRDFTINGMFFDPLTQTLYDYVGGQQDLKNKILRAIGNPQERFTEDKLRMLRAVRFTHRFQLHLEEETRKAILALAPTLLPAVSIERVVQELTKMSQYNSFREALKQMDHLGLLSTIFPHLPISQNIELFPDFPQETPLIIYLLELFNYTILEQAVELCRYLKLSNKEVRLATFYIESQKLFSDQKLSLWHWAHFYADPASPLLLKIAGAKEPPAQRDLFFQKHQEQRANLSPHIERIVTKRPLVTADHLLKLGLKPGVQMGLLLKEAEKIAINLDLQTSDQVIDRLKKIIIDVL